MHICLCPVKALINAFLQVFFLTNCVKLLYYLKALYAHNTQSEDQKLSLQLDMFPADKVLFDTIIK